MATIRKHLDRINKEIAKMNSDGHVTEGDEFFALNQIEIKVQEAREVFERTKKINNEGKDERE